MNTSIIVTYGLLTLSLTALWLPKFRAIYAWQILCAAAIGCGLLFGIVHIPGVVSIVILGVSCYLAAQEHQSVPIRFVAGIIVLVVSIGLSLHIVPGLFSNPKVIVDVILSEGGIPYSRYLNFDKTIVGLFLLGFAYNKCISTPEAWVTMLKGMAPIAGLTMLVIMGMSMLMGYVRFEPKWSPYFGIWAWSNLFLTCIAEESMFRGFLQRHIVTWLAKYRYGTAIGIFIPAGLFGLAHYPGGIKYVMLATVAGIGYGWAYHHTRHIEASILSHFFLNTVHFLFFTYPALASAIK